MSGFLPFAMDCAASADTLEALRKTICPYVAPDGREYVSCDCKYANRGEHGSRLGVGEATGCPELRDAIKVLRLAETADYQNLRECHDAMRSVLSKIAADAAEARDIW